MKELEGRTGIVTGGSSGIGYAIANTLAQAGAKVYAISRSGAVKSGMAPSAEGVIHVRGDVTDGARMRIENGYAYPREGAAGVSALSRKRWLKSGEGRKAFAGKAAG